MRALGGGCKDTLTYTLTRGSFCIRCRVGVVLWSYCIRGRFKASCFFHRVFPSVAIRRRENTPNVQGKRRCIAPSL